MLTRRAVHRFRIVPAIFTLILLTSLVSVFSPTFPVRAATFTVTKLADTDDGACNADCSLREAVAAATTSAGADMINLSVSGTYLLGSELNITSTITIRESAGVAATLSGGNTTRLFVISTASGVLTLNGLTVQNGNATTAGGCIQIGGGTLNFNNGTLQNCSTTASGGAIAGGNPSSVYISNSTLQNNTAGSNGGAISQSGSASIQSISNTTFTNNQASSVGGAIYHSGGAGGSISIANSTFNNNRAQSISSIASGGAIHVIVSGSGIPGTITDSTFTNNQAVNGTLDNNGGAIYKTGGGGLNISGSVFTGNSAERGGALYNSQGTQSVTNSRIESNTASNNGGAYYTVFGATDSISGSCIVNNSNTAVHDADGTVGQNTTATGNWWGSSWGPQITAAGGNSAVSLGDSISGNGTANINVGLTNASSDPPTGNWITTIPIVAGAPCTNLDPSYVVTKTADTNDGVCNADCSLREAITAANASAGSNMITFASGANGTITLGSALPNITGTLTITGNGVANTIISGNNAFQIFRTSTEGVNLTLSSLRLTNGLAGSFGGAIEFIKLNGVLTITNATLSNNVSASFGGAVYFNSASFVATNVTFQSNSASFGGAIDVLSGTLTVNNSMFTGNSATTIGAAINYSGSGNVKTVNVNDSVFTGNTTSTTFTVSQAIVNIDGSSFTNNSTTSSFANVLSFTGEDTTATLTDTLVENNVTSSAAVNFDHATTGIIDNTVIRGNTSENDGGGVYLFLDTTMTITDSQITGNSSGVSGGGLFTMGTSATITNSLIAGNSAVEQGGGIYVFINANVTLNNTTVSGNTAGMGGGIRSTGILALNNSIVANSVSGGDCSGQFGTINARNSLIEDGLTCVNGTNTNNLTGDPALDGTYQLTSGSIAINEGNNSLIPAGVTTDLAGNARIQQTTVDMGAYEFIPPSNVTISPASFNVNEGANANYTITRTGSTTNALAVTVNILRGTNTTEADYVLSGGSISAQNGNGATVTIPAGSGAVDVNIAAVADLLDEANETLRLTLVDGAVYNLGATTFSTATIIDMTEMTTLTVDLTLQGRPTAPNAAYMVSGEIEVRRPNLGTVIVSTTFTADNMGRFTVANVPTGTVDIWVKGSHTLARLHQDVVVSVIGSPFVTAQLREGDADNDNSVILVDFSLLAASFGTQVGNPGYDARADFNMDGLINLVDFSLLASNFGGVGG